MRGLPSAASQPNRSGCAKRESKSGRDHYEGDDAARISRANRFAKGADARRCVPAVASLSRTSAFWTDARNTMLSKLDAVRLRGFLRVPCPRLGVGMSVLRDACSRKAVSMAPD